mmetsp:Transcript_10262/g.25768  ORF Transcript_10262/g.25768 Transcript_10262/m.25768 type:complete len:636 (-) Transcript_10262:211-2118(-)
MGVILWLSDLHLDPYYGTDFASSHKTNSCSLPNNATLLEHPYGQVGCDAPPGLLEFALENVQSQNNNNNSNKIIDFVLVTGDFARHSMDILSQHLGGSIYDPVESILSTCIQSIQTALPNVPIVPVLGNNDVVPDYYLGLDRSLEIRNELEVPDSETMLATVAFGLKDAFSTQDEFFTFEHGGYFSRLVDLPSKEEGASTSILVMSLNTVLYSVNHQPDPESNGYRPEDPYGQFEWMKSQLQAAANPNSKKRIVGVYLAGHIPPSIGSYRHSQLWHDQYLEEFFAILRDYSQGKYNNNNNNNNNNTDENKNTAPPILGNFYGHVHTEEFRLLTYDNDESALEGGGFDRTNTTEFQTLSIPVLVTSSITPIYGSNPSYRLVKYDDQSGALLDYSTHYLDLERANNNNVDNVDSAWIELPSFVEAFGVPNLSLESFQSLLQNLEGELVETMDEKCNNNNNSSSSSSSSSLWETFWKRQNLYSPTPDDADDSVTTAKSPTDIMVDWLCTFGASTKNDYETCLETTKDGLFGELSMSMSNHPCQQASGHGVPASVLPNSSGNLPVAFVVVASGGLAVVVMVVALCFWNKRAKRSQYFVPRNDEDPKHDGVFVIDNDDDDDENRVVIEIEAIPNENGQLA